jgi:hypothetical protein
MDRKSGHRSGYGEEEKRKEKAERVLFMSHVGPLRFYGTRPG